MAVPTDRGLAGLLPPGTGGWKAVPPDGLYDAGTLYEYIDGGAEVYRHLNVRSVLARRYVKEGSPEILADLFDMGSAPDAFGAFHHDRREGEPAGIGQESEYDAGALAFWKGRYFVSILAVDESPEIRRAVLDLGRRIGEAIHEEGAPPDLLGLLPERGLLRHEVRYFHSQLSFNRYFALSDRNLLDLTPETEGLLARYRASPGDPGEAPPYTLLLVAYPSAAGAGAALERLRREIMPGAGAGGAARTANGTWAGARTIDRVLAGVFDAPSRRAVTDALEQVIHRSRGGSSSSGAEPS